MIRGRGGHYRIFEPGADFDAIKQTSDRGHRAILSAIARRDPAAAATAASAHIAQTELWLRALRPEPQVDLPDGLKRFRRRRTTLRLCTEILP